MRPDDIRPMLLWYRSEIDKSVGRIRTRGVNIVGKPNPERHEVGCDVYWGSHGCSRPQGHDGDCWCDCCDCENHPDEDSGCVAGPPYYGPSTSFYGDAVSARGLATKKER
jgi:hypothetical protein